MAQKLGDDGKRHYLLHFLDLLSPTLMDAAYYAAYDGLKSRPAAMAGRLLGFSAPPASYSLTNLLRAPIEEALVAGIRFFPPMVVNARRLVGMVTAGDALEITYQAFEPLPEAQDFLNRILELLISASNLSDFGNAFARAD